MKKINGQPEAITANAQEVFAFISDFRHFDKLMPEQINGWEAEEDRCRFNVPGMGTFALKISEKNPNSLLIIVPDSEGSTPVNFELHACLEEAGEKECLAVFHIRHELPMMIEMMASRPLKNLADGLAKKLREHFINKSAESGS